MRLIGLDLLRGMAALGIVGCHLCLSPRTAEGDWIVVLCDFNVGVFAAIAGFLSVERKMNCRGESDFLHYGLKRVRRLLPTYLFWSAVFIVATCAFDLLLDGGHVSPKYGTISFWMEVAFLGGSSTHLWFLPCLLYAQILLRAISVLPLRDWMWVLVGFLLIVASAMMRNWFGTYPLRLFAFLVTGYGLGGLMRSFREHPLVSDAEVTTRRRPRLIVWGGLAVVGLVAYVLLRGWMPAFIRGWFAAIPVLIFFVTLPLKGKVAVVASALGMTSMGVYLLHPFFTRGLSVIWMRVFQAPFGAVPVASEWALAWLCALSASLILIRVPFVGRFVR